MVKFITCERNKYNRIKNREGKGWSEEGRTRRGEGAQTHRAIKRKGKMRQPCGNVPNRRAVTHD